jgi:integrase
LCHHVLQDAVDAGYLVRNPARAKATKPPSAKAAKSRKMRTWSSTELAHFLDVTKRQRIWPAWVFLATTGARRQEALGLRWSDVDLEAATASISQVVTIVDVERDDGTFSQVAELKAIPKNNSSRRQIQLDPKTVAVLRAWKAKQAQERLAFGAGYARDDLVFTRPDGSLIHPKRLTQEFGHNIGRHSLSPLSPHGLRHTWATLALEAGVDITVVSKQLGHSSIAITADVYAHVTPRMLAGAADKVAALIFGS